MKKEFKDRFGRSEVKADQSIEFERKKRINIIALEGIMKEMNSDYKREMFPTAYDDRTTLTAVFYRLKNGTQLHPRNVWDQKWPARTVNKKATCERADIHSKQYEQLAVPFSGMAKELAKEYGLDYVVMEGSGCGRNGIFYFEKHVNEITDFGEAMINVTLAQEAYDNALDGLMDFRRAKTSQK